MGTKLKIERNATQEVEIEAVRQQFPILSAGEIVYFDNAATALMPKRVAEAMMDCDMYCRANVGRGLSRHTKRMTDSFERARDKVAGFLGALPEEIVFVRNTTEAINIVACGLKWQEGEREIVFVRNTTEAINIVACGLKWQEGERVVTTLMEHHSNLLPWQIAAKRHRLQIDYVHPHLDDIEDMEPFVQALNKKTRLFSIIYVSNVLGVKLPVAELVRLAKERGALTLIDAAQAAPHMPINVKELGVDYLALSAYKMFGPSGVGVLYISKDAPQLQPLLVGGGMISTVRLDGFETAEMPHAMEAGTQPISAVVGFGETVDFINEIGYDFIEGRCSLLTAEFDRRIRSYDRIKVYGLSDPKKRLGIFAFNIDEMGVHRIASLYDYFGNIVVRSGQHCAIPLHQNFLQLRRGTVRASLAFYNTLEEIEKFMHTTERILELVGYA